MCIYGNTDSPSVSIRGSKMCLISALSEKGKARTKDERKPISPNTASVPRRGSTAKTTDQIDTSQLVSDHSRLCTISDCSLSKILIQFIDLTSCILTQLSGSHGNILENISLRSVAIFPLGPIHCCQVNCY